MALLARGSGCRGDHRPGSSLYKWGGYHGDVQSTVRWNRTGCLVQRVREAFLMAEEGGGEVLCLSRDPEAGTSISREEARVAQSRGRRDSQRGVKPERYLGPGPTRPSLKPLGPGVGAV